MTGGVWVLVKSIGGEGTATSNDETDVRPVAYHGAGGPPLPPVAGRRLVLLGWRRRVRPAIDAGRVAQGFCRGAGIVVELFAAAPAGVHPAPVPPARQDRAPRPSGPASRPHGAVVAGTEVQSALFGGPAGKPAGVVRRRVTLSQSDLQLVFRP